MRFLLGVQLQPFTIWISNTCSQGCEEDNGCKKQNENEFMAALNFLFQNFKCWITFKNSFFTLRSEDTIHIQPSESFSFTELKQLLSKSYSCIRLWIQSLTFFLMSEIVRIHGLSHSWCLFSRELISSARATWNGSVKVELMPGLCMVMEKVSDQPIFYHGLVSSSMRWAEGLLGHQFCVLLTVPGIPLCWLLFKQWFWYRAYRIRKIGHVHVKQSCGFSLQLL